MLENSTISHGMEKFLSKKPADEEVASTALLPAMIAIRLCPEPISSFVRRLAHFFSSKYFQVVNNPITYTYKLLQPIYISSKSGIFDARVGNFRL